MTSARVVAIVCGLGGLGALAACGDNHVAATDACTSCSADAAHADAPRDAPGDADPLKPSTLAGTGLCLDDACTQISPYVYEYEPRWALWADGATKRRWIYLPPDTSIDTSDPDYWQFPVGTKIWKEFSQDGAKVETRYIVNTGVGANPWFYMPYQWNLAGDATTAVPDGAPMANGTIHDIPSQGQCRSCHDNTPNHVLGFGALQLDYTPTDAGMLDLDGLNEHGLLDVRSPAGSPHYPLPASTDGGLEAPAIGYLHANCSHCHSAVSPIHDITPMAMHLNIADLGAWTDTGVYTSMIGLTNHVGEVDGDSTIIVAGDPAHSIVIDRMSSTDPSIRMPELGSNIVDPTGVGEVTSWIAALPH